MSLGPQCWNCRERRVRCGSEVPTCAKCADKDLPCLGYGATRPLRWKKPENPQTVRRQQKKGACHRKNGDVRSETILSLRSTAALSYDEVMANEISYYNERIAPDLVPLDSPSNPFRWEVWKCAKAPVYLNHAYASISVLHRIVQRRYPRGGQRVPTEPVPEAMALVLVPELGFSPQLMFDRVIANGQLSDPEDEKFCRYYVSALKSMNAELSKAQKTPNLTLLAGVMMLLYSQLQQAAYGQWRVHLEGFKSLINFFGGWEYLISQYADAASLLPNVLIIDVIATTTCPVASMPPGTTQRHLQYLRLLPRLDHEHIALPIPIPTQLLRAILTVNLIRASPNGFETDYEVGENCDEFTIAGVLSMLNDLARALNDSPNRLIEGTSGDILSHMVGGVSLVGSLPGDEKHSKITSQEGYAHYINCYHSAVTIYATEFLLSTTRTTTPTMDDYLDPGRLDSLLDKLITCESMNEIRESAYESLLLSVRFLMASKGCSGNEGYWKLIFWPLAIAGVQSAVYGHDVDCEFIRSTLHSMTADLGSLAMRDAALLVDRLRSEIIADEGSVDITWDDIFQNAPLFLI